MEDIRIPGDVERVILARWMGAVSCLSEGLNEGLTASSLTDR